MSFDVVTFSRWRELNSFCPCFASGPILSGIRELNVWRMCRQNLFRLFNLLKYVHLACSLTGQTWTWWHSCYRSPPSSLISPPTTDFRLSSAWWHWAFFRRASYGYLLGIFGNHLYIPSLAWTRTSLVTSAGNLLWIWQLLSRTHHMSPARGWKWKWSNGVGKGEIWTYFDAYLWQTMWNHAKTINGRVQTFRFSVLSCAEQLNRWPCPLVGRSVRPN